MQQRKRLEEAIESSSVGRETASDIDTLFELAREGENVNGDLEREIRTFEIRLERLETAMLLSGENDANDAIVTIHPGAGGTEGQDWAEMLLRMYLRWAERHGFRLSSRTGSRAKARGSNPPRSRSTARTFTGS